MTITEKSAYIKGLAEGLNLDKTTSEGKLIEAMLGLIDDMALSISDLEAEVETLNEYIEEIDEDLGQLEEFVYEIDDDCDCDCDDDDDCDGDCDCCDCDCGDEFFEAICPNCGETVCFDDSIDEEDLICPACNKSFTEGQDEE